MANHPYKSRKAGSKKRIPAQKKSQNTSKHIKEEDKHFSLGKILSVAAPIAGAAFGMPMLGTAVGALAGGIGSSGEAGGGNGAMYTPAGSYDPVPAWLKPYIQGNISKLSSYAPAPAKEVAGLTQDQKDAFQGVRDQQGKYSDAYPTAMALQSLVAERGLQGIDGQDIAKFWNPYTELVTNRQKFNATNDYADNLRAEKDKALKASAFGGSRSTILDTLLNRNYQNKLEDIDANALNTNYNQSVSNAFKDFQFGNQAAGTAATALGNTASQGQAADYRDLNALKGAGDQQQQYQQSVLDAPYTSWQRGFDQLTGVNNALNATVGQNKNQMYAQNSEGNKYSNLVGAGAAGASILGGLFGGGGSNMFAPTGNYGGNSSWTNPDSGQASWVNPDTGQYARFKEGGGVDDSDYSDLQSVLDALPFQGISMTGAETYGTPHVKANALDGLTSTPPSLDYIPMDWKKLPQKEDWLQNKIDKNQEKNSPKQSPTFLDLMSKIKSGEAFLPPLPKQFVAAVPDMPAQQAKAEANVPDPIQTLLDRLDAKVNQKKPDRFQDQVNNPLLQLGIAMMGSKSPTFAGGLSEGAKAYTTAQEKDRQGILAENQQDQKDILEQVKPLLDREKHKAAMAQAEASMKRAVTGQDRIAMQEDKNDLQERTSAFSQALTKYGVDAKSFNPLSPQQKQDIYALAKEIYQQRKLLGQTPSAPLEGTPAPNPNVIKFDANGNIVTQ